MCRATTAVKDFEKNEIEVMTYADIVPIRVIGGEFFERASFYNVHPGGHFEFLNVHTVQISA